MSAPALREVAAKRAAGKKAPDAAELTQRQEDGLDQIGKKPATGAPTVAEIGAAIQAATTVDELDIARDLIASAPAEHHASLYADATARAEQLTK